MPVEKGKYDVVPSVAGGKRGFRVRETLPSGQKRFFSKKALSKKKAEAQRVAIFLSEQGLSKPKK